MVNVGVFKFRCPQKPSLFLFFYHSPLTNKTTKASFLSLSQFSLEIRNMSFRDPNPVTSRPGSFSDPAGFAINSRIMLTAILIILFFVILMVSLHLYSRCYLHRSRRFHIRRLNRTRRAAAAMTFFADPSSTSAVTNRALDPSVVKSLPIFTFSAATASDAIECAVCLSEFEESEPGRVLPSCKHAFHVECIDMWFHSHSSCPLCRSLVEPIDGVVKSAAEEVAISISEPVSGDVTNDVIGDGTSETLDHEDSGGKPAASEVSESQRTS
ncbi:hypothetical protein N665_0936s0006 [Sinapis alba]|nr:hypothetical protein N665_0936s0006 [Sinapis alba]